MTFQREEKVKNAELKRSSVIETLSRACLLGEDALMMSIRNNIQRGKSTEEEPFELLLSSLSSSNDLVVEGLIRTGEELKDSLSLELTLMISKRSAGALEILEIRNNVKKAINLCAEEMLRTFLSATPIMDIPEGVFVFDEKEATDEEREARFNEFMKDGFLAAVKGYCGDKSAVVDMFIEFRKTLPDLMIKRLATGCISKDTVTRVLNRWSNVFSMKITSDFGIPFGGGAIIDSENHHHPFIDLRSERNSLQNEFPENYGSELFYSLVDCAEERIESKEGFMKLIDRVIKIAVTRGSREIEIKLSQDFGGSLDDAAKYIRSLNVEIEELSKRSRLRCKNAVEAIYKSFNGIPVYKRMEPRRDYLEEIIASDFNSIENRYKVENTFQSVVEQWELYYSLTKVANKKLSWDMKKAMATRKEAESIGTGDGLEGAIGEKMESYIVRAARTERNSATNAAMDVLVTSATDSIGELTKISIEFTPLAPEVERTIKVIKNIMKK